jgi:hypothetical protein
MPDLLIPQTARFPGIGNNQDHMRNDHPVEAIPSFQARVVSYDAAK